jgi:ATP-binding cassette subfamily B protein
LLLLSYFALTLPAIGDEVAALLRQYPTFRNRTLRALEPLGAPEEPFDSPARPSRGDDGCGREDGRGVAVRFESVAVVAGGRPILEDIDVAIEAGAHVAVVGPSGAGKSSLVGLLLGWHRPARGRVLVDGEPLDAAALDRLRAGTIWIDPSVRLWNRSLLENLLYGAKAGDDLDDLVETAGLHGVLERLPEGLGTRLGEGGGLLSGGEGQLVRVARGLARRQARLVLDEPFRGLDSAQRRRLKAVVRRRFAGSTLVCITHDLAETWDFPRILVVREGRIVEDGAPADLAAREGSTYRGLLEAEEAARATLAGRGFRRLSLDGAPVTRDRATGSDE